MKNPVFFNNLQVYNLYYVIQVRPRVPNVWAAGRPRAPQQDDRVASRRPQRSRERRRIHQTPPGAEERGGAGSRSSREGLGNWQNSRKVILQGNFLRSMEVRDFDFNDWVATPIQAFLLTTFLGARCSDLLPIRWVFSPKSLSFSKKILSFFSQTLQR